MGLRPPFTEPLDDQHSAMESGAGITVRHENLRSGMGLRQATPHPEVLLTSSRHACYQRPGQVHLDRSETTGNTSGHDHADCNPLARADGRPSTWRRVRGAKMGPNLWTRCSSASG